MRVSHSDVIEFIHSKNKDISLAHTFRLNDPNDYTYTTFSEALEEAHVLIDDEEFTFTNPRTEKPHVATPETKEMYERYGLGELFVVASDLAVKEHDAMQCACQGSIDSAISKTCNFPNSAS